MSIGSACVTARQVEPPVGDLMRVAAAYNPFIPRESVVERTIVSERIGLLIGDAPEGTILLYLWTEEDPGGLMWLVHLARWKSSYPAWRSAHGLPACSRGVRIIVAVPGVVTGLRDAVRLLGDSVTVVRYQCLDVDGSVVVGWESDTVAQRPQREDLTVAPVAHPRRETSRSTVHEALTPDEWAFFQPLKSR
ncbi:MAG: hypothetical protein ACOYXR_07115 [Nitrospirota bacterium]